MSSIKDDFLSTSWAQRQRNTNRMVRFFASHLIKQKHITAKQVYALCQLTWITHSETAYIASLKIPAINALLNINISKKASIDEVSQIVAEKLALPKSVVKKIIAPATGTGFTNFYNAYRNTAKEWVEQNFESLLSLLKDSYNLSDDEQGLKLIKKVEKLPGIIKKNAPEKQKLMPAEYLITPLIFSLDERLRFPIINGNKNVQEVLRICHVSNTTLSNKYKSMIKLLYPNGEIKDAADLDQIGDRLIGFVIDTPGRKASLQFAKELPISCDENKELSVKDESDLEALNKSGSSMRRQKHNVLTNKLIALFKNHYILYEGKAPAQYDVVIQNYNVKGDLLVEVKSSVEMADVRMAIGQLYSYSFALKADKKYKNLCLCVLLPEKPAKEIIDLLEWLSIGLLWFSGENLGTSSDWLKCLT